MDPISPSFTSRGPHSTSETTHFHGAHPSTYLKFLRTTWTHQEWFTPVPAHVVPPSRGGPYAELRPELPSEPLLPPQLLWGRTVGGEANETSTVGT